MRSVLSFFILGCFASAAIGHGDVPETDDTLNREINFPDTAEHLTLVVDLHTHSVFSDGHVWPQIRVSEAERDDLDAMAVTEHLEWQPHLADIPHPDRNRSYEVTREGAKNLDLLIIPGAEITREAPAGHMNAVFVSDANKLMQASEPVDPSDARAYYLQAGEWPAQSAVQAANDQGAFVFWNHPFWGRQQPDGIARIPNFHKKNAKAGLLHGIEVANGIAYSEEAFAIALKHDLAVLGVSDVHNLIDWDYPPHEGEHRPVTLVFATERSVEAIREALFDQRTVVWFRNLLFGRSEHLEPLLEATLSIESEGYFPESEVVQVKFTNRSDARLQLQNETKYTFVQYHDLIEVPAHGELTVGVKPGKKMDTLKLEFKVLNALTAPGKPAVISAVVPSEVVPSEEASEEKAD